MKKSLKKLSLSRETLRNLEASGLRRAAGGSDHCTSSVCIAPTQCECETQGCVSQWGQTCGTVCSAECSGLGC